MVPWWLAIFLYYCVTTFGVDKQTFPYLTDTRVSSIIINALFLNGLFPSANNKVVLGGWYLGTLVIIWLLFPYLFKLKLKYTNKLIIIGIPICAATAIILKLSLGLSWDRNSFLYFSFLIQLPCVLIGMFYKEINKFFQDKNKNFRVILTVVTLIVLVVFFYKPFYFTSLITPILTSLLIIFILPYIDIKENRITKTVAYFGEKSLYIYLYHVFVVWHFQYFAYRYILNYAEINHTMLFFMLLPIEFILIMFVSIIGEMVNRLITSFILKFYKNRFFTHFSQIKILSIS